MEPQACYIVFGAVLGGIISGLVGVGLSFFQRCVAGREEQQRLLFQVYRLVTIPAVPAGGGDASSRTS